MFGPIHSVVFDFDGTLVDTMDAVMRGLGGAITHVSGREVPQSELVASFGPAPQAVLAQWVEPGQIPAAMAYWLDFENREGVALAKAFAGVPEMLAALKKLGVSYALFTGRDRAGTLRILEKLGWLGAHFSPQTMACGDDGFKPKPSPDALVDLMGRMNMEPTTTLMVGDHVHDMSAGRGAGCKTAAALWDLSGTPGDTERGRFRAAWNKWPAELCDLRLNSPKSLEEWLVSAPRV